RSVPEHFLPLARVDRFRTHMHGAARRFARFYLRREASWTTVFVQLEGRVDERLEINIELITEIAILDQRPPGPTFKLHRLRTLRVATNNERPIPVFRTRVSTTNIFSAAEARLPLHDNVSNSPRP